MYNMTEKKRKKFYENAFRDHYRRHEQEHYFKPMQKLVEDKFVKYYMSNVEHPRLFHEITIEERDRSWKGIEAKVDE